jgi:hypothetical protein
MRGWDLPLVLSEQLLTILQPLQLVRLELP